VFVYEIEQLRERQADGGVLDIEAELNSLDQMMYLHGMAEHLLEGFIGDRSPEHSPRATYQAVYRAAVFACQTAYSVHGDETEFDAYSYLMELTSGYADPQERFELDVQDYLAENPHVDAFIGQFADELDEGRNQLPAIELTAGMVFMLVERHLGEAFIQEQAETASASDFEAGR